MLFLQKVTSKYVIKERVSVSADSRYLYHRTALRNLASIKQHGLKSNFRPRCDNEDAYALDERGKTQEDNPEFCEHLIYFSELEKPSERDSGGEFFNEKSATLRIHLSDLLGEGMRPIRCTHSPHEWYISGDSSYALDPTLLEVFNEHNHQWEKLTE